MKFLFILLLLPVVVFCQRKDSVNIHRVSIGVIYSPDYSFRFLRADPSEQVDVIIRNDYERPKPGFTTGLNLLVKLKHRLVLETGIQYSNKGEKSKHFEWDPTDPSAPISGSYVYDYNYFDFPVQIGYSFARMKGFRLFFLKKILRKVPISDIAFSVSGGASANVFFRQKTTGTFEYKDGHTTGSTLYGKGFSPINYAAIGGVGVNYFITSRFQIRIEPVFRCSITPIKNAPVREYLCAAGVNAGIYYTL